MVPEDLSQALMVIERGARLAQAREPDVEEFEFVAELVETHLAGGQDAPLQALEQQLRVQLPQALSWYLSIVRTLAGTIPEGRLMQHLILIPLFSSARVDSALILGPARHEIEGSLEEALNLGEGTLRLLPCATPIDTLQTLTPVAWRRLAQGAPDSDVALGGLPLGEYGGALVGRWSVGRADRPRLTRKLVHATQRTPELVSWQQRTQALLAERVPGEFTVYPALQLQDFFSGFRQFGLMRALERAYRALPRAMQLHWSWEDRDIVCDLLNIEGRRASVRMTFPEEQLSVVSDRLRGFCLRRGLEADPFID